MKYLITGGAGFIGSNIAKKLSYKNDVIILDNFSSGKKSNIDELTRKSNITLISKDLQDVHLLKDVLEDVDGIFHQAAVASVPKSVKDPLYTNKINLDATLELLVLARDCGVKKIVMASSASVYGNNPVLPKSEKHIPEPLSPYAVQKLSSEYYCSVFSELYGLDYVCLRYFNVYGPNQDPQSDYAAVIPKFIENLINKRPFRIYGDGNQTRDFIYVDDVVSANIKSMETKVNGVFNVAGGREISLNELAGLLFDISGYDVEKEYFNERDGDVRHSVADISKIYKYLDFKPQYSLNGGLKLTYDYFKNKYL